jgi:hypothetical protein
MIRLQFTRNNGPLSMLIRWIFDSPVSHFSLRMDNLVFHSNLLGARIVMFENFKKGNYFEYIIEKDMPLLEEEKVWLALQDIEGKSWDFKAAFFLGWHGLMRKWFKKPMPEKNSWGSHNAYLCTEVIEAMGYEIKDLDMNDPYRLYLSLTKGS